MVTMASINPNKHLKELFVSNLTGSSMLEISSLTTTFSVLVLVRHCIGHYFPVSVCTKKDDNAAARGKDLGTFVTELIVDYFCIVVPYILFMTVLAEWSYGCTIVVLIIQLFLVLFKSAEIDLHS